MLRAVVLALLALAPSAARAEPPAASVEHPQALQRFFQALGRLESTGAGTVRVLQFGDSHTAADHQTAAARRALQARFGDAGRGMLYVGLPYPTYAPEEGVKAGMTHGWRAEPARRRGGDGRYGLGGTALESSTRGARAWLEPGAPAGRLELGYLKQAGGGSFEVWVDGERRMQLSSRAEGPQSAWEVLPLAGPARAVEVRLEGDGEVRLFGAALERSAPGLVYDSLGINGARASVLLEWDEAHLAEQLAHRSPDLVVLAYGTNESGDRATGEARERQLAAVLERVARAVPQAACLVLGPPDRGTPGPKGWTTLPALLEVIAAQRRAAEAAGCAYFSQFDAMGGEGSMASWARQSPPLAARDRVHLSKEGYAQLGGAFARGLVRAYETWHGAQAGTARRGSGAQ